MIASSSSLDFFFGEDFLKDHAGRLITDPDIALVELVANAWDAGAKEVRIIIDEAKNNTLSIEDDGTGMTQGEFETRWRTWSYNRVKNQGRFVIFPDGTVGKRRAFGKNGKGRHALFCFAESYIVETWRDGIKCDFNVETNKGTFKINLLKNERTDLSIHGTKLSVNLVKKTITTDQIINLIGSKFIFDPEFNIYVNNELITLSSLEHLTKSINLNTNYGPLEIGLVDTKVRGRTSLQNGIAWWVYNRLVGKISWKFSKQTFIDARSLEGKRYTFIVKADILEEEVKPDWTGFKKTEKFEEIFKQVSETIIQELNLIFSSRRGERKKEILKTYKEDIKNLPVLSRDKIGKFIDEVQMRCPTLGERDLDNLTLTLINLERSHSKYSLLEKIATVTPLDVDALNEVLSQWTIKDAKTVLDELKWRLNLIEKLRNLIHTSSDEVHELQPLFKQGLWIFGPEFDSAQFTSNQTIKNAIKKFFDKKYQKPVNERPDFIILPDSSVALYASDEYDENGELRGIRKIVIIELKKGLFKLTINEINQATEYASLLIEEGHISRNTQIIAYVLGSTIAENARERKEGINITITPYTYNIILNKAYARTFNFSEHLNQNCSLSPH